MTVSVAVKFDEFAAAATKLPAMKRAPAGAKGKMPTDTLLSMHDEGILVETPVFSQLIVGDRSWPHEISVDAKELAAACEKLKKIVPAGKFIRIRAQAGSLFLNFESIDYAIKIIPHE